LAFEYDVNVLVPLLMVWCFEQLNLIAITSVATCEFVGPEFELEENMFSVGASIEQSSQTIIIGELSLFKRLSIPSFACVDPSLCKIKFDNSRFPNIN
jgi:hypothetical protein